MPKQPKTPKDELEFWSGKNEPTLFDLIDRYFPEPYRTTYMDAENLYKSARAAAIIKLPPGHRIKDYDDMVDIHQIASELHKKFPEMRAEEMADHPRFNERFGEETEDGGLEKKAIETIVRHIRALQLHPRGRPKKA